MIVRKYNIELHRLRREDIELVRVKRNSEGIRRQMFYQQEITEEEQEIWFSSVRNIYNYYFIIQHGGKKVGLIHGKNIDYDKRTAEGGIFIWDEACHNNFVPISASLIMIDLTFNILALESTFAEVRASNVRSKHYNAALGYERHKEDTSIGKEVFVLTAANHCRKAKKIREAISRLSGDHTPLAWDDIDFSTVSAGELKILYEPLPAALRNEVFKRVCFAPS
jgi:RimJ/RimL family protein N-acetyltransferase